MNMMATSRSSFLRSFQSAWATVLATCILAQARAGGGHSYSGGGGGGFHSSGGGSSFHSYGSGGYVGGGGSGSISGLITLIIIALIVYYLWKKLAGTQQVKRFRETLDPELQSGLRRTAPSGSPAALQLQQKLGEAFVGIQKAWDGGKMDPVRAILSDGVYHRFQIQLDMNRLQGIRNKVEMPTLLSSRILSEDAFGRYLSIDFLIRGRVVDSDIRIDNGAVVSGGDATVFEEIWSFTRLASAPVRDALQTLANCPKCAAPLSEAGGSRCGHCGAVLNSGAYDWVLAEITQAQEWAASDRNSLRQDYAGLPAVPGADAEAWLSPQELEDRASVVFIRYQSALHKGNLGSLNMFATPELLKALGGMGNPSGTGGARAEHPLYRLAVGAVDLLGFAESQGLVKAWARIKYSGSDAPAQEGSFQERIMVFCKAIGGATGKGDLSCMTCPNCGGPIESSDQAKCAYCDNVLSSPAANWVLCDYGDTSLLSQLAAARRASAPASGTSQPMVSASTGKSGAGAQIRILSAIVLAAMEDNVITEAEDATIREFARHFGVGPIFVDVILKKAKENPEALAEVLDKPTATRWLNNLIIVAAEDGRITPEEEALLISFAKRQGMDDKQVRLALKAALKIKT
jgi:hypothetical protein